MTATEKLVGDRERALELIQQYGWNNTSFQTLEPYFKYWFDPEGPGVVAYYRAWGSWVAAGAPVCPHERMRQCALGFAAAAARAKQRVCFFGTLERFVDQLGDEATSIKIGEQPWWDPQRWDEQSQRRRSIGSQLRRAQRLGVQVRQIPSAEMEDEHSGSRVAAQRVVNAWRAEHRMATMSFVVFIDPFSFAKQRRFFLAQQHEEGQKASPVGFLALIPIYAREGWFLEDLVRAPYAPNGTAESLVDAAIRAIALHGCRYATLGLSPLKGTDQSRYGQPQWAAKTFALSRYLFNSFFNFAGLAAFKAKFRPDGWEEVYLTGIPRATPLMLLSVLAAFARSRPAHFASATLWRLVYRSVRVTAPVYWQRMGSAFAIALAAWIALLCASDGEYWFASDAMRNIWIAFDCAMVILFISLSHGAGRRASYVMPLALTALGAVLADLFLTAGQALAFFVHRTANWANIVAWLAALAGPTLASMFLSALAVAASGWNSDKLAGREP